MGAVVARIFKYLRGLLGPLFRWLGRFLGLSNFLQRVSWRKVLFATFLASMLLSFGHVLISVSKALGIAFDTVFTFAGANNALVAGSSANLGVLGWFGLDKIISLSDAIPMFPKFAYIFGLDWVLWASTECMLLWLIDVGLHRILIWAGSLVRVAYDTL